MGGKNLRFIRPFYTVCEMSTPKAKKPPLKTWTRKDSQIYLHISGVYYARLSLGGKETWRSLDTDLLSVARTELAKLRDDAARLKEAGVNGHDARRMTGADAIALRQSELQNDPAIKAATRHFWNQVIIALRKRWPEFLTTEIRKITEEQCQAWVGRNKDSMSPERFNCMLGLLKRLFALAIKKGARRGNPVAEIKRRKEIKKDLSSKLPELAQFPVFIGAIRNGGGRFSKASAELVEFLAYTGMRTGEAEWVRWSHCDFDKGEILVVGDPTSATKNSEFRRVPMIAAARQLLERIRQQRPPRHKTDKVLLVNEAQKAMDRAFAELGMPRFTHHDLRHFFATRCIESGVDIPTVSKWMGHKDGGALAMKTYGHLRNEHSLAAAAKVSFSV